MDTADFWIYVFLKSEKFFHELDTSLESAPENITTCLCEGEKGADY